MIGERPDDALPQAERAQCVEAWTAIGKNVKQLKSYWRSDALDYTWYALTRLLEWLNVDVLQWSELEQQLGTLQSCPASRRVDGDCETLTVLCTNRLTAPHYDLLRPRVVSGPML